MDIALSFLAGFAAVVALGVLVTAAILLRHLRASGWIMLGLIVLLLAYL